MKKMKKANKTKKAKTKKTKKKTKKTFITRLDGELKKLLHDIKHDGGYSTCALRARNILNGKQGKMLLYPGWEAHWDRDKMFYRGKFGGLGGRDDKMVDALISVFEEMMRYDRSAKTTEEKEDCKKYLRKALSSYLWLREEDGGGAVGKKAAEDSGNDSSSKSSDYLHDGPPPLDWCKTPVYAKDLNEATAAAGVKSINTLKSMCRKKTICMLVDAKGYALFWPTPPQREAAQERKANWNPDHQK